MVPSVNEKGGKTNRGSQRTKHQDNSTIHLWYPSSLSPCIDQTHSPSRNLQTIQTQNWVSALRPQPIGHSAGVNPSVRVQCAVVPSVEILTHDFTSAACITARPHRTSTHVDPTHSYKPNRLASPTHREVIHASQQNCAPLGPIYRVGVGPQPSRPNSQGGSAWCPQTNSHSSGASHRVQCQHAEAPYSRPRICRTAGAHKARNMKHTRRTNTCFPWTHV